MSETFWKRARELATQYGAALIADEIQCGLGRTGRDIRLPATWRTARYRRGGEAAGGRASRSARFWRKKVSRRLFHRGCMARRLAADRWLARVALEFLNIVEEKDLLENVRARGAELRAGLAALAKKFDFIREMRGEGLMLGLSFPWMARRT